MSNASPGAKVTIGTIAEERGPGRAPVADLFRGKLLRATLVFGFLRDATDGVLVPRVVVALVMTLGGVVVATLGHETKGKPL